MLPLGVYPAWMQTLAYFTPFPAILGQGAFFMKKMKWGMGSFYFGGVVDNCFDRFFSQNGISVVHKNPFL